ncbi:MAG: hypothetical protein ABSC53_08225 [Bacteroidota bacterium]
MKNVIIFLFFLPIMAFSQSHSKYRIFFSSDSAKIDTNNEAKDEPGYLSYSVKIDLNGDGVQEEFIAALQNCSSGGCPWVLYDGKSNTEIGAIDGSIVYILKDKRNGFPLIEAYWGEGCCAATVHYYAFDKKEYKEVKRKHLTQKEMEEYFDAKPPNSAEFKELK